MDRRRRLRHLLRPHRRPARRAPGPVRDAGRDPAGFGEAVEGRWRSDGGAALGKRQAPERCLQVEVDGQRVAGVSGKRAGPDDKSPVSFSSSYSELAMSEALPPAAAVLTVKARSLAKRKR